MMMDFDRLFVAADAIGLDDLLRVFVGADQFGRRSCGEHIDIMGALPSLFKVICDDIFVRQVTVRAFRRVLVGGVIIVLVHRVHHMAVVAGLGMRARVRGRVRYQHKNAHGDHKSRHCDQDGEGDFFHGHFLMFRSSR